MKESQTMKSKIGLGLFALAIWYFFATVISETLLLIAVYSVEEVQTILFLLLQGLAIIAAYQIVLGAKIESFKPLHKKGAISRRIFILGSIAVLLYFGVISYFVS